MPLDPIIHDSKAAVDFYNDLELTFGGGDAASANPGQTTTAPSGKKIGPAKAPPFLKAVLGDYRNAHKANEMITGIKNFVGATMKIGTSDVGSLLESTIGPREAFVRNEETPLLNLYEADDAEELYTDDWVYRIPERRQGNARATRVNPEATLSTTDHATVRTFKLNSLAFWGDPVSQTFVAGAQVGAQRPGENLLRKEIDAEILAIRKAKNYDYWNSSVSYDFTPPNVTTVGGLVSRIQTNTNSISSANLSDVFLNQGVDAIATPIGYRAQKVLFCDPANVQVIRAIEINRYGGNNPVAFMEYNATLAKTFAAYNIEHDRIWESGTGKVVPIVHDQDLSATAVMMTIVPEYRPRQARFRIGGEPGPWMFVRPVYDLKETVFILDGGSVDDPAEETRYLWTMTS